ncbi:MAG: hypothetical protein ABI678_01600 [Kofleriaceae bacterium]
MDDALRAHVASLFPGSTLEMIEPLRPDATEHATIAAKAAGYGEPIRIVVVDSGGIRHELVWRTLAANEYGHDRRADRAGELIQAYEDFATTPAHVRALDVGLIGDGGVLCSLRSAGEPYLITSYARGEPYATDLRRIGAARTAQAADLARVDALAEYLAALHTPIANGAIRYRRAIRDLIGSGEGIFGIVDGYPVGATERGRLRAIEDACLPWRDRLFDRHDRLTRTHGDFHPFNILFDGSTLTLLDASRGAAGDPADDVTALAVNFLLFAIDDPAAWHGLGVVWRHWWAAYLSRRTDDDLLSVVPPFFAWRVLVVCNPRFYPQLTARGRDRLLGFAEDLLAARSLDPLAVEELFR